MNRFASCTFAFLALAVVACASAAPADGEEAAPDGAAATGGDAGEAGNAAANGSKAASSDKGATSGNVQRVVSLTPDCDGDAVLARVIPAGPACHTGCRSCFGDDALHAHALGTLDATIAKRAASTDTTEKSYTRRLLDDRNLRLKKIGEEAAELVTACADGDLERAREETADVIYHSLVALCAVGGSLADVQGVLAHRRGKTR